MFNGYVVYVSVANCSITKEEPKKTKVEPSKMAMSRVSATKPPFSSFQAIPVSGSSLFWGMGMMGSQRHTFQTTPGAEPLGAKSDELGFLDQIQAILRQDGVKLPGNLCGP